MPFERKIIEQLYLKLIHRKLWIFVCFTIAATVIVAWFYFTYLFSVNIFFSDSWDYNRVFINGLSVFQQFIYQHGPQRLGLGLVITGVLNQFSGWDETWVSYCVAILLFLSAIIYLIIKRMLFTKLNPFDVMIVMLVLSLNQFEALTISPFISHSAIPALFVSLYCLSLFVKPLILRNALLLTANLNLIFSSFGFFMGPVSLMLFGLELLAAFRKRNKKEIFVGSITLFFAMVTILLFFINYSTAYVGNHITLLLDKPWQYLFYISLSYSGVFGYRGVGMLQTGLGFFILGLVSWVFVQSISNLISVKHKLSGNQIILNKILLVLTSYSLLFSINLAFGRIEFGLALSQSPRYIPYLIPSLVGVYFYFNCLTMFKKSLIIPALFIFMLFSQYLTRNSLADMKSWHDRKDAWKTAYLKYDNANMADSVSNFSVYPDNKGITGTLDYLKKHKLNLYKESGHKSDSTTK